jgi:serine/threonine protein kinase
MKVLRKNVVLEGQDLAYVMLERDILIQCQSNPFIIQLIYAFQNTERLFFLMEVAKAGNFYRLLIKQAPRPFLYERIVYHSGEIACALSFLHSKRIVCYKFFLNYFNYQSIHIGLSGS